MEKQEIQINKNKEIKPVLEFQNFSKKYSRKANYAVKNASFKVFPVEFHGFIGANGAGKTTTIKSLIGAYGSYEGEIKIFGQTNKNEEVKKRSGLIVYFYFRIIRDFLFVFYQSLFLIYTQLTH